MSELMEPFVAVFNLHINDAGKRANAEFIQRWGRESFNREIAHFHAAGIMSIFDKRPTRRGRAWVRMVTRFVNEPHSQRD